MKELVEFEKEILKYKGQALPDDLLIRGKKGGFADKYLAKTQEIPEEKIRSQRKAAGMVEVWADAIAGGIDAFVPAVMEHEG
jgi:carbamoyl-phosphate synthase large subunit